MAKKLRQATAADAQVADSLNSAIIHLLRRVAHEDDTSTIGPAASSALSVVVFGGEQRLGDLARAERVSLPTMSRVVDGLERAGFAQRRRDDDDRRQVWVGATRAGVRFLHAGRDRRVTFLTDRLRRLSAADRRVLGEAAGLLEELAAELPSDGADERRG